MNKLPVRNETMWGLLGVYVYHIEYALRKWGACTDVVEQDMVHGHRSYFGWYNHGPTNSVSDINLDVDIGPAGSTYFMYSYR